MSGLRDKLEQGVRPPTGSWPPKSISGAGAASRSTWAERPDPAGIAAAWCYSDRRSYMSGEIVTLYLSSSVQLVDVRIYKDGETPLDVMTWKGVNVKFQPVTDNAYTSGCDWEPSIAFPVPMDFAPGAYVVEIREVGDASSSPGLGHHIFFIRASVPDANALLLIATTSTWTAYNDWGGASHYRGLNPDYPQGASPSLSTRRPWARGQVWLPEGAPRMVPSDRPTRPAPARYEFPDWAYANGFTRYYAASGWPSYELPFVRWAERSGYTVHVISQDDLELHPDCLEGYRCAVVVGHDEYWSRPMREKIDRFVEEGGRVARFAGNYTWQIRLESEGSTQTCFKYLARERDPVRESDPSMMTSAWEDPRVGYPGAATFGVNSLRGTYVGWGGFAPRAPRGFQVFRPEHWALEGTGLCYADMFGDEAGIFAFEVDGLEYAFEDGRPIATAANGAPDGLQIVAMGWANNAEDGLPEHAYSRYFGNVDARFAAAVLDESSDPKDIDKRARGCGVVVAFTKGRGEVFCAGSCEWVRGLMEPDFYTSRITRNVLDRFLAGPVA